MGGQIAFDAPVGTATTVTHWISAGNNNDGFGTVLGVTGDLVLLSHRLTRPDGPTLELRFRRASGGAVERWGFMFDLASSTIVTQIPIFLNVTGVGTINGNGFDSTPASFTLTVTQRQFGVRGNYSHHS